MLTPEEITKLNHLIDGRRSPENGLERHFLRVISGEAKPCSQHEQEWYNHWQQGRVTDSVDYRLKYESAATLLREREEKIRILEEHIAGLRRESERQGSVLQQKIQSIEAHAKEISRLEGWLKSAQERLIKYEPVKNFQEPVKAIDDKWNSCQACGRSIDFCRCSG